MLKLNIFVLIFLLSSTVVVKASDDDIDVEDDISTATDSSDESPAPIVVEKVIFRDFFDFL